MKTKIKLSLAFVLALTMCLSLFGMGAWAEELPEYDVSTPQELVSVSQLGGDNGYNSYGIINLKNDIDMTGVGGFQVICAGYGKTLIFNGNGHTITGLAPLTVQRGNSAWKVAMFYGYPGSTLTVRNLTLENAVIDETTMTYGGGGIVGYNEGTLILEDVDIIDSSVTARKAGAYVGYSTGQVTMTECDVTNVTVTGVAAEGKQSYAGDFIGQYNTTAELVLTDCKLNGSAVTQTVVCNNLLNATITIVNNPTVAEVNGVEYTTLAAAVEAVPEGTNGPTVITLLNDIVVESDYSKRNDPVITIPSTKNVTLDLNGHSILVEKTINQSGIATNTRSFVRNYGIFTLNDSIGTGIITSSGLYNGENSKTATQYQEAEPAKRGTMTINGGRIVFDNMLGGANVYNSETSVLTINGGSFEVSKDAIVKYGTALCLNNRADANAEINGGTFINERTDISAVYNGGNMTINDATITGVHRAVDADQGNLTINGGKLNCTAPTPTDGTNGDYCLFITNYGEEPTVIINDGAFTGGKYAVYEYPYTGASKNATIQINDGTFTGDTKAVYSDVTDGNHALTLTGGTYSSEPDAKYIAEHYYAKDNGDGTFTLEELPKVAKIGTTEYYSLATAIEAATDGDTVELLADTSETEIIEVTKSITIEGNNNTLNTSATRALWIAESGVTLTINDLDVVGDGVHTERGLQVNLNKTDVTLNVNHCTVEGITYYAINVCNGAKPTINIDDSTIKAWGAINLWSDGYTVNVRNSTLEGYNDKSYNSDGWNDFGTVILEGDTTGQTEDHSSNCNVNLENCKIIASTSGQGNKQYAILFNNPSAENIVTITGSETQVQYNEAEKTLLAANYGENNSLVIYAGKYSDQPDKDIIANGYEAVEIDDGNYQYEVTGIRRTVSFDANAQDVEAPEAQILVYQSNPEMKANSPEITRAGYAFDGWFENDSDEAFDFNTEIVNDITLTAHWTINTYTVSFDTGTNRTVDSQTVEYGATATQPANPTRSGYTFRGWRLNSSNGSAYEFSTPVTDNITLVAAWTANSTPVRPSGGSSSTTTPEPSESQAVEILDEETPRSETPETSEEPGEEAGEETGEETGEEPTPEEPVTIPDDEAPVDIGDEEVPLSNIDNLVITRTDTGSDKPTTYTSTGVKNADGSVNVVVKNAEGEEVEEAEGGVLVEIHGVKDGDAVAIVDEATGEILEIVGKALVENGTAYTILPGTCKVQIVFNTKEFTDVDEDSWYNSAVKFASANELFNGYEDGSFQPDESMTRSMLVTVLWRLQNKPEGSEADFGDVNPDSWYAQAVAWAEENDIAHGYENGDFRPSQEVTRQEMAVMLFRYMKSLGYDVESKMAELDGFADAGSISSWATDAMRWAVGAGIINGVTEDTVDAQGTATRAQVAAMLQRLVSSMVK